MVLNLEKHLSRRAQRLYGSLGSQTSVPISGLINLGSGTPGFEEGLERSTTFVKGLSG